MSIQNNELMTTATRSNFLLPQAVETTFTAEELAEDMDGIQLNFQQVKVPAGGALQYEIPTEDPDNPDYSRYLEGVILFHHPSNAYWPETEDGEDDDNAPPQCQALDGKLGHGRKRQGVQEHAHGVSASQRRVHAAPDLPAAHQHQALQRICQPRLHAPPPGHLLRCGAAWPEKDE